MLRALGGTGVLVAAGGVLPASAQTAAPAAPAASIAVPGMSSYQVGPGDVISVRVFEEPEFSRDSIRLNDAGTISMPLIGEVPVLGLTVGEIEKALTDRLRGRILVNPVVNVALLQYRTFFIQGQVKAPGTYPFMPGLTVRKAAILAGGFGERASMRKIYVIRDKDPSQKQLEAGVDTEVGPGDLIFIGETFF